MSQFIIGELVGAIVSFFVFALCSMAKTDDRTVTPCAKKKGEDDARSK